MIRAILTNAALCLSVFLYSSCQSGDKNSLILENTTGLERAGELIVLKKDWLENKLGKISKEKYVVVADKEGQFATVQYDDLDKDGAWDEIALLQSFKPNEKKSFLLSIADQPATIKAVVRAHARHSRKNADNTFGPDLMMDSIPAAQPATDFTKQAYPPFLTEGPAWENDKTGFRLYFDVRNGKDIWGKTTAKMMLDEVGTDTSRNYHQLADWGMDILKVGTSLGAGALALAVQTNNGKDSLIRLGGVNMGKVYYEKICDGPVRAIIRLRYPEWKVMDGIDAVNVTDEISIWGGQYFYESKVTVNNAPGDSKLVTGIVNLYNHAINKIDTAGSAIAYTWGKQSENKDNLGMAIVAAANDIETISKLPEENKTVTNTYTVTFKPSLKKEVNFRFYAGWEKSDDAFKTASGFKDFLVNQAVLKKEKIIIK